MNGIFTVMINNSSARIRVEEYKRPTFRVEFPKINKKYEAGDTLEVRAKALTYAGVPVQGARVKYTDRASPVAVVAPVYWHGRVAEGRSGHGRG